MPERDDTSQQIRDELEVLRRRIEDLRTEGVGRRNGPRTSGTSPLEEISPDSVHEEPSLPRHLLGNRESTETIDLNGLFTKEITASGSFDIGGKIWKTTFGKVIQALPIAALLVEHDLRIAVANEAFSRISPDYERILGAPYPSLFPVQSVAQKAQSVIEAVFSDRKSRVFRAVLKVCETIIWGRLTLRSIRIASERLILVLLEDLTREKEQMILNQEYQAALQQSEARFRQLYDQAPMMMHALDLEGRIRSVNAKWIQHMGYSPDEIVGNVIDVFLTEESRDRFRHAFPDLWTKGEAHDVPCQYVRKDASVIQALVDSVVTEDASWGPVAISTIRDITHELLLEKQLREAQKMEALGTLAGGVAHDFNNLLQIIFGYADLVMLRLDKDSPNYQAMRAIREASRRGSELVKQVLTFSRRVESNPRPLDLNHEVEKAARLLGRTLPKMISIGLNLEEGLRLIHADPIQVEQIILNLAVNAKDAMPEGGRLVIGTLNVSLDEAYCRKYPEVQPGDYVCLSISDTGHGMDKDVLEHIFEPFFSTKKPGQGTGLGLSSVFGLVKMHAGHITCDSHRGKGTTFRIYFPATEKQAGWPLDTTSEMPAFGTETILFVDDEELVRTWAKELLSLGGYTVLDAANGREGVEVFRKEKDRISLVILDLIMPEMGGKQCLEELLGMSPNLKAIIASGLPIDPETRGFFDTHAKATITKPFKSKELLQVVRQVLDSE